MIHLLEKFKRLEKMTRWTYALHLETRKLLFHFSILWLVKPSQIHTLSSYLLAKGMLKDSSAVRRSGPEVQEPYVIRCFRSFMRLS